jgi:hypothetical protein
MRITPVSFLVCGLVVMGIPIAQSHAQDVGSLSTAADCWNRARNSELAVADDACVPVWIDSLQSRDAASSARARRALTAMGGRAAVNALRADYERAPNQASRRAVIMGMATTGSPEDIAFLVSQVRGPFTGKPDIWPATQTAATTLGLLRATAARDALSAALSQYGESGFAGRAVAAALASLDRPPCADSVRGDLNRELVRIVMQCGPQSMWTNTRYRDPSSNAVWSFADGSWRLGSPTPSDTGTTQVTETVTLARDGRHANVSVSTWCGMLCGEGWTFSLLRIGNLWRVVGAEMTWVS